MPEFLKALRMEPVVAIVAANHILGLRLPAHTVQRNLAQLLRGRLHNLFGLVSDKIRGLSAWFLRLLGFALG